MIHRCVRLRCCARHHRRYVHFRWSQSRCGMAASIWGRCCCLTKNCQTTYIWSLPMGYRLSFAESQWVCSTPAEACSPHSPDDQRPARAQTCASPCGPHYHHCHSRADGSAPDFHALGWPETSFPADAPHLLHLRHWPEKRTAPDDLHHHQTGSSHCRRMTSSFALVIWQYPLDVHSPPQGSLNARRNSPETPSAQADCSEVRLLWLSSAPARRHCRGAFPAHGFALPAAPARPVDGMPPVRQAAGYE